MSAASQQSRSNRLTFSAFMLIINFFIIHSSPTLAEETGPSPSAIFNQSRNAIAFIDFTTPTGHVIHGTGFVVSGDGFIVTARHNVEGYVNEHETPLHVHLGAISASDIPAEVLNLSYGVDVVLLKMPGPSALPSGSYSTVARGDARQLVSGDDLYVLGFPEGGPLIIRRAMLSSTETAGSGLQLLWALSDEAKGISSRAPVLNQYGHVVGVFERNDIGTAASFMYPEFYLGPLASIANWQAFAEPFHPTVMASTDGALTDLSVRFRLPNAPVTTNSNMISVYTFIENGANRHGDQQLMSIAGNWRPGDDVSFHIRFPTGYLSESDRHMHFCIGSLSGCLPSPDLLHLPAP